MLFVEAKDAPNADAPLDRAPYRERRTIQEQLENATKQLKGGDRPWASEHAPQVGSNALPQ